MCVWGNLVGGSAESSERCDLKSYHFGVVDGAVSYKCFAPCSCKNMMAL